jgi:hypothetical protein
MYDQQQQQQQQQQQCMPAEDYAQETYQVQQTHVPSLLPQATFAGGAAPMHFMIPGQSAAAVEMPAARSRS